MMNKKGSLVLRDVLFLILIFTGIILFASIFVNELAITYEDTEMGDEFAGSDLYANISNVWGKTTDSAQSQAQNMSSTGIPSLVSGGLGSIGKVLLEIASAPITFAEMIKSVLLSLNVPTTIIEIIGVLIIAVLYILIVFIIVSAFLQGGKL